MQVFYHYAHAPTIGLRGSPLYYLYGRMDD